MSSCVDSCCGCYSQDVGKPSAIYVREDDSTCSKTMKLFCVIFWTSVVIITATALIVRFPAMSTVFYTVFSITAFIGLAGFAIKLLKSNQTPEKGASTTPPPSGKGSVEFARTQNNPYTS